MKFKRAMVLVSNDPKSIEKGAGEVFDKLAEEIRKLNLDEEISYLKSQILAGMMLHPWLLFIRKR